MDIKLENDAYVLVWLVFRYPKAYLYDVMRDPDWGRWSAAGVGAAPPPNPPEHNIKAGSQSGSAALIQQHVVMF